MHANNSVDGLRTAEWSKHVDIQLHMSLGKLEKMQHATNNKNTINDQANDRNANNKRQHVFPKLSVNWRYKTLPSVSQDCFL